MPRHHTPQPGASRPFLMIPAGLDPARDAHGATILRALPPGGGPVPPPAKLRYVFIVFTNRSGSTYLGDLLSTTGFFNYPVEMLDGQDVVAVARARGFSSFPQYFFTVAAERSQNGHLVLKASIGQVAILASYGILASILDRSHFIVVERMDKLAQAVSWQIAAQTGLFTSLQEAGGQSAPRYDRALLHGDIERFAHRQALTDVFMGLNGIVPLHLTYELVTTRPELATSMVCSLVGLPELQCRPGETRLRKQATGTNAAWCKRFLDGH